MLLFLGLSVCPPILGMIGHRVAAAALVAYAMAVAVCAAPVRPKSPAHGSIPQAARLRQPLCALFNGDVILDKDGQMLKVPLARFHALPISSISAMLVIPHGPGRDHTK